MTREEGLIIELTKRVEALEKQNKLLTEKIESYAIRKGRSKQVEGESKK